MNWQSTKFIHAIGVQIVASVALFTDFLTGAEWIAASTIALGIYSWAEVTQKRNEA